MLPIFQPDGELFAYDNQFQILKIAVFQEWMVCLFWNERDMNQQQLLVW